MVTRLLIAALAMIQSFLALAFVVTDGPGGSQVLVALTPGRGIHVSDLPVIGLWAVGSLLIWALVVQIRDQ